MPNKESDPKLKLPEPDSRKVDKIIEALRKKSEIDSKVNNNEILPQKPDSKKPSQEH